MKSRVETISPDSLQVKRERKNIRWTYWAKRIDFENTKRKL